MKTLPMHRDEKKSDANVECSTGTLSVYRYCGYCKHCKGVRMGPRVYPSPQEQVLNDIRRGTADDEGLLNAALQFNLLVRDGDAIECDDDAGEGYQSRYR